jgi:hypothetical protein
MLHYSSYKVHVDALHFLVLAREGRNWSYRQFYLDDCCSSVDEFIACVLLLGLIRIRKG